MTTACACTPFPTRKTCPARWLPTSATRNSPPTARTAASPSPPPWGCCFLQPHLQPVCDYRQQRGEPAEVREVRKEYAVALPLFKEQQHQPRVDRPVPERSPFLRADLGTGALQRHGVERRRGGAEAYQERCGQPAGKHGVRAAPQHHRLPDTLLGGDARQRGGLPGGREFPYLHRAGGVPLHGGNQLPQFALALRHQDGGQAHGKTAAPRHFRPADEAGHHDQPQQVRVGSFGQRQILLHEPPREAILRAGYARGTGGHGKLLSGTVRDDTAQDKRGADGVYFTYTEEKPISFNPFYTDDYVFDVEKKDSIKTLLLTLWKSEDDKVTKTESGELGSAVNAYIERIKADRSIVPSFNTFYEYMRDDYRRELAEREIKVEKEDFNIDNMLTTMRQYYRGGRYDFLLNSTENIDLLGKRFIVFEIDSIKENRELFPVVTIIIMEAFHQQDAPVERRAETTDSGRGLEGSFFGEHG